MGRVEKNRGGERKKKANFFISFVIKGNLSFHTFSNSVEHTGMNTNTLVDAQTPCFIDEIRERHTQKKGEEEKRFKKKLRGKSNESERITRSEGIS